jgi:hypothetical protein
MTMKSSDQCGIKNYRKLLYGGAHRCGRQKGHLGNHRCYLQLDSPDDGVCTFEWKQRKAKVKRIAVLKPKYSGNSSKARRLAQMKYRIVTDGKVFRIERRWGLIWSQLNFGHSWHWPTEFNNQRDAERQVKQCQEQDSRRWSVIE